MEGCYGETRAYSRLVRKKREEGGGGGGISSEECGKAYYDH